MSIALVSRVGYPGSGNGGTSSAIITTGASLIVVAIAYYPGGDVLTDSASNTWTPLTQQTQSAVGSRLYYCVNPSTSATHTFTVTRTNYVISFDVMAFSGTATSSVFDLQAGAIGLSLNPAPGSLTPSVDNEIVVYACSTLYNNSRPTSVNLGTLDYVVPAVGFWDGVGAGYIIQTSKTAANPVFTQTASYDWAAVIASFKASSGAATHATSGALTSDNAVVAGSSLHLVVHQSSGALTSQSGVISGSSIHAINHQSSGALTTDNAAIAGASLHSIPHASSGTLTADNAVAAGTSLHLVTHQSSGSLTAQSCAISGTSEHSVPGAITHYSSGDLTAQAGTISGSAVHVVNHQSAGDLTAQDGTISGAAVHVVNHQSSGDLTAQNAAISGSAIHVANHQSAGALAAGSAVVNGASIHNLTHVTAGSLITDSAVIAGAYQGGASAIPQVTGGWSPPERPGKKRVRKQREELGILPRAEDIPSEVRTIIEQTVTSSIDQGLAPKARNNVLRRELARNQVQNADNMHLYLTVLKNAYNAARNKQIQDLIHTNLNQQRQEEEDILLLLMAA